jgi:hypothetical protein
MQTTEENAVRELVARVFIEFVGARYSDEGRREFLKYINRARSYNALTRGTSALSRWLEMSLLE